ncbi:hypothetical protein BDN67DRAFT_90315 [Paxillus ammoniavirescens]|nr:hypothetical protein BDN67DRAFT_90315 [Paxillus ammoniavirescens]
MGSCAHLLHSERLAGKREVPWTYKTAKLWSPSSPLSRWWMVGVSPSEGTLLAATQLCSPLPSRQISGFTRPQHLLMAASLISFCLPRAQRNFCCSTCKSFLGRFPRRSPANGSGPQCFYNIVDHA